MELVELPAPSPPNGRVTRILAVSPSGAHVLLGDSKHIWLMSPDGFTALPDGDEEAICAAFSQDESRYAVADGRGVRVRLTRSNTEVAWWRAGMPKCVRFLRDSPHVLTLVTFGCAVWRLDARDGIPSSLVPFYADRVWKNAALTADGSKAVMENTRSALICDLETGARNRVILAPSLGKLMIVSPDATRGFFEGGVVDLVSGGIVQRTEVCGASPSGKTLSTRKFELFHDVYVTDALGRWECTTEIGLQIGTDAFVSDEVMLGADLGGALRKFRVQPLAWNQALALVGAQHGSLGKFFERDGDHAVMHRVLKCLLF